MKTYFRKILVTVLIFSLTFNIVSCGKKKDSLNNTANNNENKNTILVSESNVDNKTNYSIVKFGHYEQDNNKSNGAEEIEWLVLDEDLNNFLLLSKNVLDCKNFNDTQVETIYTNSTLRNWLNADFIGSAFSAKEAEFLDDTSKHSTKIMKGDRH